ncbi:hypothetical protein RHS01_10513 [Rhizoctonia solani]|uniref:Transposase n=1 Tax=Rhizoctonia solani TaxID=456999 RepID=A0A8H7I1S7_9AGAM|nr:hypothetical protein RHS01_10513 [Rhizoctonia solani]
MARYTSPETKAQIIALKKLEYSDRAIVQLLQPQTEVSHATVGRIWANDVRFAALALARSRVPTAANIRRQYFPAVGSSTLRRYLESWVYGRTNAAEYPCSLIGIEKPVAWAHSQLFWPQSRWDDIVFSDEVRIELFGADSGQYYWRRPTRPRSEAYSQADTTLARQLGRKRPPMAVKKPGFEYNQERLVASEGARAYSPTSRFK